MDQHVGLSAAVQSGRCRWPTGKQSSGDSKKRIVGTCAVFALVPILNSAFYALNSSYYARWYYMPVLVLCRHDR